MLRTGCIIGTVVCFIAGWLLLLLGVGMHVPQVTWIGVGFMFAAWVIWQWAYESKENENERDH